MKINGMTTDIYELRPLLGRLLPQRFLTWRLFRFLDTSGIMRLLSSSRVVTLNDVKMFLDQRFGFDTFNHTRGRMIQILIDFLCECGYMERHNDTYRWKGRRSTYLELSNEESELLNTYFGGQVTFFEKCIEYACEFLTGGPPLFRFDDKSLDVWESFLANAEFAMARSVLVKLLSSGTGDRCRVLNLCSGLGFDITALQENMPHAEITAIDFTDVFYERAYRNVRNPDSIRWIDSDLWKGFGYPLPFHDQTFDIVFFACADPYIPRESRHFVYSDLSRILKSSGSLGLLTNSYPDEGDDFVSDMWIRRGILCHDFAESVCEGWSGFSPAEESITIWGDAGFVISSRLLNSSIWRLEKA